MLQRTEQDGWDNNDIEDSKTGNDLPLPLRYHLKDAPRDILDSHHHSLEPDMVLGWRPKLPSCPLPLSYNNTYLDALALHIPTDDRFKLVYLGPRCTNSVQINQQNSYFWRYRSRYNTSISAVKEAVKRVGEGGRRVAQQIMNAEIGFDSSFESGNLDMAVRVKRNEYDLFLRCDTNTRGHTAWFYFKVQNREELGDIQFNICNFGKKKNLYSQGMRPYVLNGSQWSQQGCFQVNWAERICRYGFDRKTFQLQFKYSFKEKHQKVYFAYSLPYTFTRLQNFLSEVTVKSSRFAKTSRLCETLGGLDVPMISITNGVTGEQNSDENISVEQNNYKKKLVLVTGRIHPGQTHSSFIIEGLINFLLSDEPIAQMLRASFIFYIIPMLNPDGVVAGNFRTSFSGKDLNRQFNKLNKCIFPQITALHEIAVQLKQNHRSGFQFYLDFHAHSSKRGLFCYGPEHPPGKSQFFKARALAKLIEQKTSIFSYKRSIFSISEHKKTTGRAHMLWKIKIPMSFTFEVSNGLYETRQNRNNPFKASTLLDLGTSIMQGFFRFGQLQMRLPMMNIKAKVDTGIKKRSGVSAKEFRKSSSKKGRTLTIKNMHYLKDMSNTNTYRGQKKNKQVSLHDIVENEALTLKKTFFKQQKEDFMSLIQEIKKEQAEIQNNQIDQFEGGSDSQSQTDDLEQRELIKLHKIIESRNEHSKHYAKGTLEWRNPNRKEVLRRRQSESEQMKNTHNSQQIEQPKKPVTSKYLMPLRFAALPPRLKKIPVIESEKMVLPPKNFALQI